MMMMMLSGDTWTLSEIDTNKIAFKRPISTLNHKMAAPSGNF